VTPDDLVDKVKTGILLAMAVVLLMILLSLA
jgi:hypothetical protein